MADTDVMQDAIAGEEFVYLTELLGLKVYDLKGRRIGKLRDAALVPLIDPVRVDRYLVGAGETWLSIRHDQVRLIDSQGIHLRDEQLTPYHSDEYMLRMVRDLLDQQIIDAQGQKVVRVNDVTFLKIHRDGRDLLHVLEVDIGIRSIFRRVLAGILPAGLIRRLQRHIPPHSIRWEFCNILEPDPQRRVRLNISNRLLEDMHPADLADIVEDLSPDDREAIMSSINSEVAAETLTEIEPDIQAQIIESLETEKAAEILEEMDADEVADVLNELEEERSEEILEEMDKENKEEVEELLDFKDDSAGGLMSTDFIAFGQDTTVGSAMRELRKDEELLESLHNIFVVDNDDKPVAAIPLPRLIFASSETRLEDLATDAVISVPVDSRQDRVAELFDKYNLLSLPVVDDDGKLVGTITVDDIVSVLRAG
jgi:CBS domain-containing protein